MTPEETQIVELRIENARIVEQLKASDKALLLAAAAGRANLSLILSIVTILFTLYKILKG